MCIENFDLFRCGCKSVEPISIQTVCQYRSRARRLKTEQGLLEGDSKLRVMRTKCKSMAMAVYLLQPTSCLRCEVAAVVIAVRAAAESVFVGEAEGQVQDKSVALPASGSVTPKAIADMMSSAE